LPTRIYCLSLYAGLPSVRLACLDRILRSAARIIGQIPKFGHATSYMLEALRWLPVRQRIKRVQGCLLGVAVPVRHRPIYLIDLCGSVSGIASGRSLRSAGSGILSVPFARTTLVQARAFCVNGPSVWNALPLELRLLSRMPSDTFYNRLKTVHFGRAGVGSASE